MSCAAKSAQLPHQSAAPGQHLGTAEKAHSAPPDDASDFVLYIIHHQSTLWNCQLFLAEIMAISCGHKLIRGAGEKQAGGGGVPWYISNQAASTKYWSNFLCPKSFACCHVQFAVWLICLGLERGRRWEEGNGRSDRNNVQLPLHLQLNAGKHLLPLPSIASIFLFVSSYVSPAFFFSFRSRVNFGMTFHRCRLSWSIESNLLWNEGELYEWASRQLSHSLALPLSLSLWSAAQFFWSSNELDFGAEERPYERSVQAPDDLLHFAFALNCECDF